MARVLVVEDYDDARELVGMILESAGHSVLTAADGHEGIALAKEHQPDAIVMDLFMPGMDGVEATRQIRAYPPTAHVPIVAYTAKPSTLDLDRGMFNAVCIKPCAPEQLLSVVGSVLRQFR